MCVFHYNIYGRGFDALGVEQMSWLTYPDCEQIKKDVEEKLEQYRIYMLSAPDEMMPKITQTYSITPPSNTNRFSSSTEQAAIEKADFDRERDSFMEMVHRGVNRLSLIERELITKRYLTLEDVYDYEVYNEMGFSETKYYRVRSKAFYKLAQSMKIYK